MNSRLLHIYRNTPFGREILFQSVYFCKKIGIQIDVFTPDCLQFLMYFKNKVITVDLDSAFLRSGDTAKQHAEKIIRKGGLKPHFIRFKPEDHTAKSLPNLATDFAYMCCPRSIRNLSTKIRLGYIGSKVRSIINNASFPILIPSTVFKKWKSITVFFGGSPISLRVIELGLKLSQESGLRLNIFTHAENYHLSDYLAILKAYPAFKDMNISLEKVNRAQYILYSDLKEYQKSGKISPSERRRTTWFFFENGKFVENLFSVPHDTLAVLGSYGHGTVKDMIFGSRMEQIQKILPNNILVVGPNYHLRK